MIELPRLACIMQDVNTFIGRTHSYLYATLDKPVKVKEPYCYILQSKQQFCLYWNQESCFELDLAFSGGGIYNYCAIEFPSLQAFAEFGVPITQVLPIGILQLLIIEERHPVS